MAAWCGRPGWAYPHVRLGVGGLVASYVVLVVAAIGVPALCAAAASPPSGAVLFAADGPKSGTGVGFSARRRRIWRVAVAAAVGVAILVMAWTGGGAGAERSGEAGCG